MKEKILFVDDDLNLLQSIQRNVRRDFECHTAGSASDALSLLEKEAPFSVVVADMRMPGQNGIELLEKTREISPETVRIMLTGYADVGTTVEAINRGKVFSFLQKPFDSSALQLVLTGAIEEYRRLQTITRESLTDPLTGLYNRRFLERETDRMAELARRQDRKFSVIFGDVNNFKFINDTYGHPRGDDMLTLCANILSSTARGSDLVFRVGGDEFVILMEDATSLHACRLIERIEKRLESALSEEDEISSISMSLGYASFPEDGNSLPDLIASADERMYRKKSR